MTVGSQEEKARNTLAVNLSKLYSRAAATDEQIRICVDMLAESAAHEEEQVDAVYARLVRNAEGATAEHKARVCACLCESFEERDQLIRFFDKRFSPGAEGISQSAAGRIAYVRNKRSDDVFLSLSRNMKGAKAHYEATFTECCEAVMDGSCEYCLLPLENSSDGRLYSFYSLLEK